MYIQYDEKVALNNFALFTMYIRFNTRDVFVLQYALLSDKTKLRCK